MRLFSLIIGFLFFYSNIQGQDSTDYQANEIDPRIWRDSSFVIISKPHSSTREGYAVSVCVSLLSKKSYSSCIYFYTPSQKIKAKGKQNSAFQKVGKWSYFYENGKCCGIAHFSKTGRKKGVWKDKYGIRHFQSV